MTLEAATPTKRIKTAIAATHQKNGGASVKVSSIASSPPPVHSRAVAPHAFSEQFRDLIRAVNQGGGVGSPYPRNEAEGSAMGGKRDIHASVSTDCN